jgi:chloride channel protein, CIC family
MLPLAVEVSNVTLSRVFTYADSTTRGAAEIMAAEGLETMPVVDRATGLACGELSLKGLLRGRGRYLERESERLRLFGYIPPELGGHN